ncbi:MAG: ribosomal protein S18-alanine N-acetyltransferase [Pseudomonadales bacterium]|nr:ribosomal protein S18-alanine N-acetyltransferase [Pseudomonadales bacterium]
MQDKDLDAVMLTENRAYSHPWARGIFADCIKSGNECWILLVDGEVLGHGVVSIGAQESHLLNVCVHPRLQGQGYGRRLVDFMLERARHHRVCSIFLEVRASNIAAYNLYESLGFNEIGLRKGYYPAESGREDAIVFAKEFFYD